MVGSFRGRTAAGRLERCLLLTVRSVIR